MEQTHTIGMRATIVLLTCLDTEVHVRNKRSPEISLQNAPFKVWEYFTVKKVWMYAPPGLIC